MKPNTPFPVPVPDKQAELLGKLLKQNSEKRKGKK
jgi:hypothetical protein